MKFDKVSIIYEIYVTTSVPVFRFLKLKWLGQIGILLFSGNG